MDSFIPTSTEKIINELQERVRPLQSMTIRGRPATRQGIALSSDCELAVATEDSIHVFFPEFPDPEDPESEDYSGSDDDQARDDQDDQSSKPQEDDDELLVLPDGTTVKITRLTRTHKRPRKPRSVKFFRRPHDDPNAPMIEWKEASQLINTEETAAQYGETRLRIPMLLPDPRVNSRLFRTMKMGFPLSHLGEWKGAEGDEEDDQDDNENGQDFDPTGVSSLDHVNFLSNTDM